MKNKRNCGLRIAECGLAWLCLCVLATPVMAQKKVEKPDVHSDFQFGTYPWSREAAQLMEKEQARLIVVGYHQGWSLDKMSKNFKVSTSELAKTADQIEEQDLAARRTEYDLRPFMLVVRERDFVRVNDSLQRHTQEFSKLFQSHLKEIEDMAMSLDGSKTTPKGQVMYETVVSGILLGGLFDAFFEDKTLMPPPPRRVKNNRFYAWLVESNPAAAGRLRRELRESSGYRIVTVGTALADEKRNVEDLQGKATVYEDADARRYRTFISLLSRDRLLPFFKSRRSDFLKLGALVQSGRYVAFAEFFAWYYMAMVNAIVDDLVAAGRITPPEKFYTYAIKAPQ